MAFQYVTVNSGGMSTHYHARSLKFFNFFLTSYESLSMGVPVISSDVGGQKELINNDVGRVVKCYQKETDINIFNYEKEEIEQYVNGI